MKSIFYLMLFVLSVSLFSCQDKEEPLSPLIGTWENRTYVDSLDIWMIDSWAFKNDSLMTYERFVRETESENILGYQMIADSWYNYKGNIFKYYYSDALLYWGGESDTRWIRYGPKEEMRPGVVDIFMIPTGTLTFSQNRLQFILKPDDAEFDMGEIIEFPARTFIKVD